MVCTFQVRRLRYLLVAVTVMLVSAAGASAAQATPDSVAISVQTQTPEQGIPVTLAFSGFANATDRDGDGSAVFAVVRAAGGVGCQPTFADDQQAAADSSTYLFYDAGGSAYESPGSYQSSDTFNPPGIGPYLVCAWLEHYDPNASRNVPSATSSTTFSTRGPQAAIVSVSAPVAPRQNVAYQLNYTTQTDQTLTLYSVIKRAGGMPCAQNFELEQQQNQSETELIGPDEEVDNQIFGGPATVSVTDTEPAGYYVICTWIEGPVQSEVDAASSVPLTVSAPPHVKRPHPVRRCRTVRVRRHHHWVHVRRCRTVTVWS